MKTWDCPKCGQNNAEGLLKCDFCFNSKPEFTVKIAPQAQEFMDSLTESERAEVEEIIASLQRNPYQGEPCDAGFLDKVVHKMKWLRQEIKNFFKK